MKNKIVFIFILKVFTLPLLAQSTKPITFSQLNDLREKLATSYSKKDLISANLLFKPYGYTKIKQNLTGLTYSNKISKIEFSYEENYITISSTSETFMKNYDKDWSDLKDEYIFIDSMSTGEDTYFTNSTLRYAVAVYATVPMSDSDKSWIVHKIIKKEDDDIEIKNNEEHTEACYAKRLNQNTIEVKNINHLTDIEVKKGDRVRIRASGRINLGIFAGSTGPNGINGFEEYSLIKDYKHGCLLLSFGSNEFYQVGEEGSFVSDRDCILNISINDIERENNSGSFIVEYSINKPLNTTPTKTAVTTPAKIQSSESSSVSTSTTLTSPNPQSSVSEEVIKKVAESSEKLAIEEAEKFGLSIVKSFYNLKEIPKSHPFLSKKLSFWKGYIYGIENDKLEMNLTLKTSFYSNFNKYPLITGKAYISQSNKKFINFKIYGYVENNTINFFFEKIEENTLKDNVFCKLNLKGDYGKVDLKGVSISGSWENYNGNYLKESKYDKEKGNTKCGNGSFILFEGK